MLGTHTTVKLMTSKKKKSCKRGRARGGGRWPNICKIYHTQDLVWGKCCSWVKWWNTGKHTHNKRTRACRQSGVKRDPYIFTVNFRRQLEHEKHERHVNHSWASMKALPCTETSNPSYISHVSSFTTMLQHVIIADIEAWGHDRICTDT